MVPKKYRCAVSDTIYDPALGDPSADVPPGTAFEDLPGEWFCADCGAHEPDFVPMAA